MSDMQHEHSNTSLHQRRMADRSRDGFTMVELLTVIAIIGVMSAIVFVSITQIQKNMQQHELDGIAKELFIVAQNHLTSVDAQGMLDRIDASDLNDPDVVGYKLEDLGVSIADATDGYRVFIIGDDSASQSRDLLDRSDSVLGAMLPFGSIDESIRKNGTYLIQYDLDTATVLNVFYARSQAAMFGSEARNFSFTKSDCSSLLGDDSQYKGLSNRNRQKYKIASNEEITIGWYGDADREKLKGDELKNPILRIENGDILKATVTDWNDSGNWASGISLKLIVTGVTSGNSAAIPLNKSTNDDVAQLDNNDYPVEAHAGTGQPNVFEVYLDDVADSQGHFKNVFKNDGLIPGEDIRVQAVESSTTKLTNVAKSATLTRNSLFDSVGTMSDGSQNPASKTPTAWISSIRHLENLSMDVSGYSPTEALFGSSSSALEKWVKFAPSNAVQITDLSWTDFRGSIAADVRHTESPQAVRVYQHSTSSDDVEAGSFMPITPGYTLTYDGRGHRISDVAVNRSTGNVGVFDTLDFGSSVSNLELVNFSVHTTAGNAGALAGAIADTVLSGVVAYNEVADDADYEIAGADNVGGLVGNLVNSDIDRCAAAVYVRASGGYAGGLVGWVGGAANVSNSYAGGHTKDATYGTETERGIAGRLNVIASSSAGGLVGNAALGNLSISSCYSTASASAPVAGGLVGYASSSNRISNGYAMGKVVGATVGAVIGVSEGAGISNCRYFEAVNEDVSAVGSGSGSAEAADANTEAYSTFATSGVTSYPYDDKLEELYNSKYVYPTVSQLVGDSRQVFPSFLTVHYGDWPALEMLVVNVPQ